MIFKTQEEAEASLELWKSIMNVMDWDIKVTIDREAEMPIDGSNGCVTMHLSSKQAVVHLLDPVDYPANVRWEQDHEKTLVHELCHIHLDPLERLVPDKDAGYIPLEQAINALTKTIISLHRR